MKIPRILCVAYYKLNGVHHCFMMKVKEVLNRFFHVYAINVIVTTCVTIFLAYFIMLSPQEEIKDVQKGFFCLRA
jgi:heme/copper-type cytochrome/quinol oxidase subunit 1